MGVTQSDPESVLAAFGPMAEYLGLCYEQRSEGGRITMRLSA